MIFNGKLFVQNVMLLAKAEISAHHISLFLDREAVDDGVTSCRHKHTSEHVNCCCFTSAVMAQQGNDLILFDTEGQTINSSEIAELFCHGTQLDWVILVEIFQGHSLATG